MRPAASPLPSDERVSLTRREWAAAWVAAVGSLLLKLLVAGRRGFWLDEYYTLRASMLPTLEMIPERLSAGHSPVYFAYTGLFWRFVGEGEVALRLSSALAAAAAVLGMAALVAALGMRRLLGPVLVLAALHPYWQVIGTEFRYMMPLVAAGIWWSWAVVRYVEAPTRGGGLLAAVLGAMALYLHGSAQFILGGLVVYVLLRWRGLEKRERTVGWLAQRAGPLLVALLLSLPLLVVLNLMPKVARESSAGFPSLRQIYENQVETFFGDDAVFYGATGLNDDFFTALAILLHVAAIVAAVRFCRRESSPRAFTDYLLAFLAGLPGVVMLVTAIQRDVDGPARYVAFLSVPGLLIFALLWQEAARWRAPRGLAARGGLVLAVGLAFVLQALNQGEWHRETIRFLREHRRPKQPVVTTGRNMNLLALEYHGIPDVGLLTGINSEVEELAVPLNVLRGALEGTDSGWLLVYHGGDVPLMEALEELRADRTITGWRVWQPTRKVRLLGIGVTAQGLEELKALPEMERPGVTDQRE